MLQKLMCDKAITTLQIATNYTKLPIRDLAGNSTYLLILNCWLFVFKFIKSKEKLDGYARKRTIMIFYIDCKNLDAALLGSPRVPKRPRTFVCCEVLRPRQHYLGHVEPVSKLTRQPKEIKKSLKHLISG